MVTLAPTVTVPQTFVSESIVRRTTSLLLIAQAIFMFATIGILGPAINWPASLDEPASVMLPLLVQQSTAVSLGYTSYFLSALLLVPISLLLAYLLRKTDNVWMQVGTGLGVLAGFAKLFGIGRWLLVMPLFATVYADPQTSVGTKEATVVAYDAFNAYAGGIGEALGVMLFAGLWTALVSLAMLRSGLIPRWVGFLGFVAASLLLIGLPTVYSIELGPILIFQGVVWQVWMIVLGITLLRSGTITKRESL